MSSWRIDTNLKDYTERASVDSQIIGATVIKSPKGPKEFTLFSKGQTQEILDTFGYPSKDYPSIQDALNVVSKSALYVASPYKNGKYGGVFVTPNGTVPFVNGTEDKEILDYSIISNTSTVGIGNSVVTTFEIVLPNYSNYIASSLTLTLADVEIPITITSSGNIETISGDSLGVGSQLDITTGTLTLVFNLAPSGSIIASYNTNMSNTYFTIFDKNPQSDDLEVKISKNTEIASAFDINVYRYNPVEEDYLELASSPYTVGMLENSKDDFGQNIYIENIFGEDNQNLFTVVINNSIIGDFVDDDTAVPLSGGNRGDEVEGSDIANVYDSIQDNRKYPLQFVFDATASSECISKFENLRNNYQKYCRFLYSTQNIPASEIIANPVEASGGVTNNRGLYCYCLNWGIVQDVYQGNDFLGTNMGLITGRLVDVLENGGGVPAYIDENGVGGILGSTITKLSQSVTETELEQLDTLNFNPVIFDNQYGYMIVGWKTRSLKKNVYSSIGQSSLADTLLNLITTSVLPTRIGKLIDEATYSIVRTGCNAILNNYSTFIEDYYVLCDNTNNTSETKNNQTLIVSVGIIFVGYAERITLNFVTYANGVNVEESIKKI